MLDFFWMFLDGAQGAELKGRDWKRKKKEKPRR
jgi:hypothetical protein